MTLLNPLSQSLPALPAPPKLSLIHISIGYDIWTTGNHEYNYGMDVLKKVMGQQKAKVLTGNVDVYKRQTLARPSAPCSTSGPLLKRP